jgi:hypothetical protein
MDTTLVMVTLLSMGMAGALSVIVWRMLRDEKQRADSRVAALVALAAAPEETPRAADLPIREAAHRTALPAATAAARHHGGAMFAERHEESPWRQRGVVMAALALVAASTLLFALAARNRTPEPAAARRTAAAAQTSPVAAPVQAGLELVSLRDARERGALTITGLVHNPRNGTTLTRVTVTAYAFDEGGTFLASGRALLDVTSLVPGDESPFQVTVPAAAQVARYRIGFRGDDGRVIAHVDKRQQGPVAVLRQGSGHTSW